MTIYRNSPIPNRKFVPDDRGYEKMLCMGGMRRRMHWLAGVVEADAIANSPQGDEDDSHEDTEHYKDQFSTSSGIQPGRFGSRAYGEVRNDSEHARVLEFGSDKHKKFRTLRNALDKIPAVHRSDY